MLKKFTPLKTINRFDDISIEWLKENNKKLVLCDIDNTLVAFDEAKPSEDALKFINDLLENDIEIILISNNTEDRVTIFNEDLNLDAYAMALKPSKKAYRKIKEKYSHINENEMISIGDQLMTDVLGSNSAKIDVVLTNQIVEKDLFITKINRLFENFIINRIKKRGNWPDEEM